MTNLFTKSLAEATVKETEISEELSQRTVYENIRVCFLRRGFYRWLEAESTCTTRQWQRTGGNTDVSPSDAQNHSTSVYEFNESAVNDEGNNVSNDKNLRTSEENAAQTDTPSTNSDFPYKMRNLKNDLTEIVDGE